MRLLQQLKAGRLGVKVRTEHAEDAARSVIAHVIDRAVRDIVLSEVFPHVAFQPEGHRCRNRPLCLVSVVACFEPILFPQLAFRRHGADDRDAPGFMGILFQRLLFHFIAAFRADLERRVKQIAPACGHTEFRVLSVLLNAVEILPHDQRVALAGSLDPLRLLLADHGITVFLQHLPKGHSGLKPRHIGDGFYKGAYLREFEAGI